eukprot:268265-Prymnesium_polylepis.1
MCMSPLRTGRGPRHRDTLIRELVDLCCLGLQRARHGDRIHRRGDHGARRAAPREDRQSQRGNQPGVTILRAHGRSEVVAKQVSGA